MKILCVKKQKHISLSLNIFVQFKTQTIASAIVPFIFNGNTSIDCQGAWLGIGQNWANFFTQIYSHLLPNFELDQLIAL